MQALCKGYLVPMDNWQGIIHSCFAKAINVKLDESPHFISLLSTDLANTPCSIRLSNQHIQQLNAHLKIGEKLTCHKGVIYLSTSPELFINLLNTPNWQRPPMIKPIVEYLKINIELLAQHFLIYKHISIQKYIQQLDLIGLQQAQTEPQYLAANIGKGQGLTPSADDFLIGILAALFTVKPYFPFITSISSAYQQAITQYLSQTNDISQHYLQQALIGHFSQPILLLIYQMVNISEQTELNNSIMQCIHIGASSGCDMLAGFYYGITHLFINQKDYYDY